MPKLIRTVEVVNEDLGKLVEKAENLSLIYEVWSIPDSWEEGRNDCNELWAHPKGVMVHGDGYFINDTLVYKGHGVCLPFFDTYIVFFPERNLFVLDGKRYYRFDKKEKIKIYVHPDGGILVQNEEKNLFGYLGKSWLRGRRFKILSAIPYDEYCPTHGGIMTRKEKIFSLNGTPIYEHGTRWTHRWWPYGKRIIYEKSQMEFVSGKSETVFAFWGNDQMPLFIGNDPDDPILMPELERVVIVTKFELHVINTQMGNGVSHIPMLMEEHWLHPRGILTRWQKSFTLIVLK